MINSTKSGIGSGVLNRRSSNAPNPKKMEDQNRASMEDFENAEKEIADKMK
jgi:hypothetical protein